MIYDMVRWCCWCCDAAARGSKALKPEEKEGAVGMGMVGREEGAVERLAATHQW
jgi:hypothetical protein